MSHEFCCPHTNDCEYFCRELPYCTPECYSAETTSFMIVASKTLNYVLVLCVQYGVRRYLKTRTVRICYSRDFERVELDR